MTDDQTIGVYAREADAYAAKPLSPDQTAALDRFIAALPPRARVLDLGCGPGLHAARMIRAGHEVDALDATPAFVTTALNHGVNARLGTFDDIDTGSRYDGIYASFSLLHADRADLPRHLDAIAAALTRNGVFFIGMKLGEREARDSLGRHYTYVSEIELTRLLKDAGLTPIWTEIGTGKGLDGAPHAHILMMARPTHA
ncbi:MAG: class I SAM-dependent methyltransferase [Pseudomonadota bacterium]